MPRMFAAASCPYCKSASVKFLLYVHDTGLDYYRCEACGTRWTGAMMLPASAPDRSRHETSKSLGEGAHDDPEES